MKKYLFLPFLLLGLLLVFNCAGYQRIPPEEAQLQRIYELQGMTKDVIFDRTLAWMAESFVSSKSVIQLKDKENGKIIGKGVARKTRMVEHTCRYTMIIDIKDNRMRITYKNLTSLVGPNAWRPVQYKYEIEPVKMKLMALSDDLYYSLTKKQKKNW